MERLLVFLLILALCLAGIKFILLNQDKTQVFFKRDMNDDLLEYRTLYSGEIGTLNYLVSSNINELSIGANIVDGLIEYDNYGIVRPALAKSWKTNDDNLVWTFELREGVKWLRTDGSVYQEVTADDFVASMEYVLKKSNKSLTANIVYGVIKNAEKFYNEEIENFALVGVKAKDKYTLEYTLEKPAPYFLSMLTYGCFFPVSRSFLEELGEDFARDKENLLYNGAYILKIYEPQNRRVLEKNLDYWDEEKVHIHRLVAKYNKEARNLAPEMFIRGEVDSATISPSVLEQWIRDKNMSKMIRPGRNSFFSYFYAFNFDPSYPDEYEPEAWRIAVNNRNFRKAIFHGLDRLAAMLTLEPYKPEDMLSNTITPKGFIDYKGRDYTLMGSLEDISYTDSFNRELAIKYKENARAELGGKVDFPIKILMPYNTSSRDWANRAQVIKQQLESLLGSDFIDVTILPSPPTGFLQKVRRSGNFSLMECNWGPDYADPETYTDPFIEGGSFNKPYLAEEYIDEEGASIYKNLLIEGKIQVYNLEKRYEAFAQAEAFLINEALVIPSSLGCGGYVASRLNPCLSSYSHFGISTLKFKGQKILDKPMDRSQYEEELKKWEQERQRILGGGSYP